MKKKGYLDDWIEVADNLPYMDYCRLLAVVRWRM